MNQKTVWIPNNEKYVGIPRTYRLVPPLNEDSSKWSQITITEEEFEKWQTESKLNTKHILLG